MQESNTVVRKSYLFVQNYKPAVYKSNLLVQDFYLAVQDFYLAVQNFYIAVQNFYSLVYKSYSLVQNFYLLVQKVGWLFRFSFGQRAVYL